VLDYFGIVLMICDWLTEFREEFIYKILSSRLKGHLGHCILYKSYQSISVYVPTTTEFVNRMIIADDYIDDDQSITRSSYCSPGILGYRIKKDLELLNEEQ
jgi:hypothetical protein